MLTLLEFNSGKITVYRTQYSYIVEYLTHVTNVRQFADPNDCMKYLQELGVTLYMYRELVNRLDIRNPR